MNTMRIGRNALCSCGSGKKYKQCCLPVEPPPRPQAMPLSPALAQQLMRGFVALQAGRFDEAEAACRAVLLKQVDAPDALHLLGLVEHGRGRHGLALEHLDRALGRGVVHPSLYSSRGAVLHAMGRYAEAFESHRQALVNQPDSPPLLCNVGAALQPLRRWADSATAYRRAAALSPGNAEAQVGLGLALQMIGEAGQAEQHFRQALRLAPRHAGALANLGNLIWSTGRAGEALELYRAAMLAEPQNPQAHHRLGTALQNRGQTDEARAMFDRAYALRPTLEYRMLRDLLLPVINSSREDMLSWRSRFEQGLQRLMDEVPAASVEPGSLPFCSSAFLLAFHGEDDLPLMRRLAGMYLHLCPSLAYRARHVDAEPCPAARLRVGFFSTHVRDHSVSRCFANLIRLLAGDGRFEVCLLSTQDPAAGPGPDPYRDFGGRLVLLEPQYGRARDAIEAEVLDLLVYQDIGMEGLGYLLAFARLARVQCVFGGHPVTTGIPNVDHFISTALAEGPDARHHYSEQLQLIDGLPVVFQAPEVPADLRSRSDFGLPATGRLYMCPMMLQKLHPDFDEALDAILARDLEGHVVLFRHADSRWEEALQARFDRSIQPGNRGRVLFLPWQVDYASFLSAVALADVVLDPFHFGIGSTVVATLAMGTPIVTRPSAYLRGRGGLAYCRLLDLPECVVGSLSAYVKRAVEIASDPELNARLRARISVSRHRLFDNDAPVGQLAEVFLRLAGPPSPAC